MQTALSVALDAAPAHGAHIASYIERTIIESAILRDGLDGIRHDLPEHHNDGGTPHWFIARGGFACLLRTDAYVGLLCRCWVRPELRGNGVGTALCAAREAHAEALGLARLDVVLSEAARSQVMGYFARGFRVDGRLAGGRVRLTRSLRAR